MKDIPKIDTKLEVKNEVEEEAAELYLYGAIRQAFWFDEEDDVISAKRVRNALNELKGKAVNVHINSPGGDVFESIAICNKLKQHDGEIIVYVDSLAGSGASIVCTGADKVYMFSNSMQMIHKAWTFEVGNADALRKTANDLDKIDATLKSSYMNRFVGTEEELESLLAEETFLTSEECLALGLCDEIISGQAEVDKKPQNNTKETLLTKYAAQAKPQGNAPGKHNEEVKSILTKFKKQEVTNNEKS
ncbi:head maturation protease, ClpP-related [Tindallia californiensis]|uniref:ATP-dependent Clp protease proteolytic subunit n=1 Tax=Tindallia californiensis TaxID=159292 RepID=A0A1H3R1N0_9FIRM|nr:head maturation protease, ClpP-related [Tindallia californiensis]SDZ19201.1 ATP-dependent protease ClpP, protease subunit [Tindallia californiensis]